MTKMICSDWYEEICEDCGSTYERYYRVKPLPKGVATPKGWVVLHGTMSNKTIAARTSRRTLCMCDAV